MYISSQSCKAHFETPVFDFTISVGQCMSLSAARRVCKPDKQMSLTTDSDICTDRRPVCNKVAGFASASCRAIILPAVLYEYETLPKRVGMATGWTTEGSEVEFL
jgi:hypothetical protein